MSLQRTPVYRNLRTRVTFLYLEYEDLLVVLLVAPVSFFIGSLIDREDPGQAPAGMGRARNHHPAALRLQIWQTARLSEGLVELPHEAACVLRAGTRPDVEGPVS